MSKPFGLGHDTPGMGALVFGQVKQADCTEAVWWISDGFLHALEAGKYTSLLVRTNLKIDGGMIPKFVSQVDFVYISQKILT